MSAIDCWPEPSFLTRVIISRLSSLVKNWRRNHLSCLASQEFQALKWNLTETITDFPTFTCPWEHLHSWRSGCLSSGQTLQQPSWGLPSFLWVILERVLPDSSTGDLSEGWTPFPGELNLNWGFSAWPLSVLQLQPCRSRACAWPWALLICTHTMTRRLTSWPDLRPASSLWTCLAITWAVSDPVYLHWASPLDSDGILTRFVQASQNWQVFSQK